MATSRKYGNIDIPKIADEEPVFILRAQDRLAEAAITMYQALAASHGAAAAKDLDQEINRFRSWGGTRKIPD